MSKFCANCGAVMDDNAKFCTSCGTKAAEFTPPVNPVAPVAPGAPATPVAPTAPAASTAPVYNTATGAPIQFVGGTAVPVYAQPKKKKTGLVIAIIVLVLLALGGAAAYYFLGGNAAGGGSKTGGMEYPMFNDGLVLVYNDDRYGYINQKGEVVIPFIYNYACEFDDGYAVVYVEDEGYSVIDTSGNAVMSGLQYYPNNIAEGYIRVYDYDTGCYGYKDMNDNWVVQPVYYWVSDYAEGLAAVMLEVDDEYLYGYIDKSGNMVIEPQFDYGYDFTDKGLTYVELKDKEGVIDKKGNLVVPPIYDYVYIQDEYIIVDKGDCEGIISFDGSILVPIESGYTYVSSFSDNGLAAVCRDGLYGYVDKKGKEVIPCIYNSSGDFYCGLAWVNDGLGGGEYYIDAKGKRAFRNDFDACYTFNSYGRAVVYNNGCYGIIDTNGKFVVDASYENLWHIGFNRFCYWDENGNVGMLDGKNGKVLLQPGSLDYIYRFCDDGYALVEMGEYYGVIDKDGNMVIDCVYDYIYAN